MSEVRWQPRSLGFGAVLVFSLAALRPSSAPAQTPANQSPSAVTAAPLPTDPATSSFATDAGVILIAIKPTMTEAYEAVIRTLHEALAKDTDEARRAAAKGWRVFKASEPDAKGNNLYVHVFLPAVPGFDYRPSLLIDALVTELANMALAPLPPVPPKKPGGR